MEYVKDTVLNEILNRDQRTIRTSPYRTHSKTLTHNLESSRACNEVFQCFLSQSHVSLDTCRCPSGATSNSIHGFARNFSHLSHLRRNKFESRSTKTYCRQYCRVKYFKNFTDVLLLFIWLISILRLPSIVRSAPTFTRRSVNMVETTDVPMWINPCGINVEDFSQDPDYTQLSARELLDQIVIQAKIAFSSAVTFRDEYVMKTFNVDFDNHHQNWKEVFYPWLPELPKSLGQHTPQEHLDKAELNKILADTFQFLQVIAVGLEQVLWDIHQAEKTQYLYSNPRELFQKDFEDTWYKLRAVLCEVQVAMIELGVAPHSNVYRDVMSEEFRVMKDVTFRNMRDWVIFRDYMNGLEYIIETFGHLRNQST